jgi:hypothetical protein
MIERVVVLLFVLFKMNDCLYMLRCPNRNYLVRYTVILITSRDFAILLLYRCLRYSHTEHESQIALFENFFTNENFSFLFISCTRNRHSTMIEDYIRRDDVIWCELNRLTLIEIESRLHFLKFVVQTKKFLSDLFCVRENDIQRWSKII